VGSKVKKADEAPLTRTQAKHQIPISPARRSVTGNSVGAGGQTKRKISAKEVVAEIEAGIDDVALMQKYGLSVRQLAGLYKKLEDAGLLQRRFHKPS
jgi:hypothetical protein